MRPTTGTLVLVLALVVRLVVAALVPLHPDEAYYWEWSRHLAAGYFDHPPAIAWFIRGGTLLLGDTPLGVRLFPVLAGFVAGCAVMRTASRLASPIAGDAAALAFVALPVMSGVFVLATPDAPLLVFAALTLWAVSAAVAAGAPGSALSWWLLTGVLAGGAMTSKYTGILLPLGLLAGMLASRSLRGLFRTPGPYVAVLAAVLVFLPVLRWNARHDWSSFRFQLGHGLGASIDVGAWSRELELLGGQLLLASPVLFVLGALAVKQLLRGEGRMSKLVASVAIVTALLFSYSALHRRVEANWPALAWVPIAILLGTSAFAGASSRWRRFGLGLGFLSTAILYLQSLSPVFPLDAGRDPTARAYGWSDLAVAVHGAAVGAVRRPWVAANRYQDAAELAFNLPEQPEVFSVNFGGRDNQYRYWPGFPDRARVGDDLLLVLADRPDGAADPVITALTGYFGSVEQGVVVDMRRGMTRVSTRRLWLLRNWKGAWQSSGAH
jgi:4-amino-4-deoxy-L-arabinose transferase-like glycosyltransferase